MQILSTSFMTSASSFLTQGAERKTAVATAALALMLATAAWAIAAPVCGDVNNNGKVTTADALLVLRKAVGAPATLICPASVGGLPKTGQTTSYGAGDDGDVQAGLALSYTDNGDGTITDNSTGLMWEKKVGGAGGSTACSNELGTCANPHDAHNVYTWSATGTAYDGGVKTIFLNQLNNRCDKNAAVSCASNADCSAATGACGFAGHRDWRLPNKKELESIVDVERVNPALDPIFDGVSCGVGCADMASPACSCDAGRVFVPSNYWSASTYADTPVFAWDVDTLNGFMGADFKTYSYFARAVRSGS